MKKSLCITVLVFLFLLAGCAAATPDAADDFSQSENGPTNIAFLSSMGCNDQTCTDVSHYHGCPAGCADYDHYHSCALDCAEAQHHHSGTHHADSSHTGSPIVSTVAFVSGMGCSDQTCTDVSHHHDCPADCADYDHYHSCALGCTEAQHHHSGTHHADSSHTSSPIVSTVAFVSGMGCSDQTCTDVSHHHDCPADCADYDHYHSCVLDCSEAQHHHSSKTVASGHGEHHEDKHH